MFQWTEVWVKGDSSKPASQDIAVPGKTRPSHVLGLFVVPAAVAGGLLMSRGRRCGKLPARFLASVLCR